MTGPQGTVDRARVRGSRNARLPDPASRDPVLAILVALAVTLAAVSAHAAPLAPAAPGGSTARPLTLKNGVRVLLMPDPHASAVSVGLWVEAGARYERPGMIGVSHLAEHLSARGVDPAGDAGVRRRIGALGGTTASFTSDDYTCFLDAVPRTGLEAVLQLETRRLAAQPSQAMLDQDRAAVRDENRARTQLNPLERPLQELYSAAFPNHPYRFPATGIDEDITRLSLKDCQDYLRARYTPDHLWVTIVGDFDPAEAEDLLHRTVESIGGRGDGRPPAALKLPETTRERRQTAAGDVPVPILAVGWTLPSDAADAAALELMAGVLSGGPESRLPRRVVGDQQMCLFARASRDRQRDAMLFWAMAAMRPGADSAAVEKNLIGEIERLAQEPIPGEELDRARKQLEISLFLSRESSTDRAQAIGTAQMISGDWRDDARELEHLRAMTPADVQKVAARTLTAARRTVVWLGAARGGAGGGR
jgi:zinc protease